MNWVHMSTRNLTCAEAAREAAVQLLMESKDYFVIGEGVPDPKACFGTTAGLADMFPSQVFDMPVSENGMTGVCIGAALGGMKPIIINMRQDFLLYAMDQIVNNAAKWHSMYGGQRSVPMVIKAFTGRGWGAGHQHAQNLEALFAHIPGLKVVCSSRAVNAKGLLISAARDPNPVLILEHRWIHNIEGDVPEEMYETPIGKAEILREGQDMTLVTWGYQVHEAKKACDFLETAGFSVELIDLLTLRPMDTETILNSVYKTGSLLVVDEAWKAGSFASEIMAMVAENSHDLMFNQRLCNPSFYPSSTPSLIKNYYPTAASIVQRVNGLTGIKADIPPTSELHDIPDPSFKGPF